MSAIGSVWNSGLAGSVGVAKDGHPLYWYLGMMWADFFPWCALLPSAVLLLLGAATASCTSDRIVAAGLGAQSVHGI